MKELITCQQCGALIPVSEERNTVTCNFCGATYQKVQNPGNPTANITMEIPIAAPERWTISVTVMVKEGDLPARLAREKECTVELADVDELTGGWVYWYSGRIDVDANGQVTFTDISGGPIWPFAWNRYSIHARHTGTRKEKRKELYLKDSTWHDPPAKRETLQVRI